ARAGGVGWIGPSVEDVEYVAITRADLFRVLAAHENAAIGLFVGPELGIDHVVLVRVLGDEVAAAAGLATGPWGSRRLVGDERAVLDAPIGGADLVTAIHCPAVVQLDHARDALAGGWRRHSVHSSGSITGSLD